MSSLIAVARSYQLQGMFSHCHWEQLRILPILANLQFATVGKVCLTRANFVKPVYAKIDNLRDTSAEIGNVCIKKKKKKNTLSTKSPNYLSTCLHFFGMASSQKYIIE